MELYDRVAYDASRRLTLAYSTSFGKSSKLFSASIRPHIYAIYGLVRIADEIVDTYTGDNRQDLLDNLEAETYIAITEGYSTNLIIHAFARTAIRFGIKKMYIQAFFKSMRLDLEEHLYTEQLYATYIYGSAEVIGLMCLEVFCDKDQKLFNILEKGARALGSAYQKVNFLRDFADDYNSLNRIYFPHVTYETFDERMKSKIIKDIRVDITAAKDSLNLLPLSSRIAVSTSLAYYTALLERLAKTPAAIIKKKRIRINNLHKSYLLASSVLRKTTKK